MIVKTFSAGQKYRGTVQVYLSGDDGWRYRIKSKNGQILGSGGGYTRLQRCLDSVNAMLGARITEALAQKRYQLRDITIPWRLVVEKRDGTVDWIGQVL